MTFLKTLREHKARRYAGIVAAVTAAILAVVIVSTLAVDLGPAVRGLAEHEATSQMKRPVHIGSLRILVARGVVEVRDFSIEGLHPADRPFFTAKRLLISLDWSKALAPRPEFIITSVDLTDWNMLVEKWENEDNFPKIPHNENPSNGPSRTTTTLSYLHAYRGQFAYEDHETPWSIVTPSIELTISKHDKYEGDATVRGGTVSIQDFVPMWSNMKAHFVIDGPILHMTRIDLDSDGAKTLAIGDVDIGRFPEMSYAVKSHLQTPRMREIFFKDESWKLTGAADFTGTFHLFKGGHDLAGSFTAPVFGINDYRFPSLYGQLHWTGSGFEIWNAGSQFSGGTTTFGFSTKPLGTPERALDRFELTYTDVDLARFTDFEQMAGQRFAGAASGRNVLEWHTGAFTEEHHGDGEITIAPPAGPGGIVPVELMIASLAAERAADAGHAQHEWGPFAPMPLPAHLPIAAAMRYRYDPDQIRMDGGRFATESTFVTFQGTTAWGHQSRMPFHVTSRDWQESDELLAGIITDFGSHKSSPVAVGGRGEFDGVFTGPFSDPRVEGDVLGEDVRAWDTPWGECTARIVVENDYVTVADGIVRRDGSEIRTEGRFALGYPRDDHGEEIDARFRAAGRDIDSLRHAFEIDDYPVSGALTGEFHLSGLYQHMVGFGAMTIDRGTAYGEPFEQATASLRFDGNGVRLDGGRLLKGSGIVNGAAYIGWDSTYSFNADARGIPVDRVAMFNYPAARPGGLVDFTAGGSGNFLAPRYDVRFRVIDLSMADEPVGQVTGTFGVRGRELSGEFDAASPRLAMTGTGRIALTPQGDSEMTVRFHDFSLDPYIRLFVPKLSPYNSAVASGSLRVVGELADLDHLVVDGTVDSLNMRLFDYAVKNAGPMKIALDHRIVRIDDVELVGEDTRLRVGGTVSLRDEQIALQAAGDANLGILQGFFRNVRGSGRAELAAALNGPMRDPVLSGSARITNGRIRHFALPNSLDAINGTIQFDSRGIRLDDLSAKMGDGRVQFGGRIGIDGYLPGDLNVTVVGEGMHLRVPEGVRSTIDADLAIRGNVKAPTLSGTVMVKSATFTNRIEPTSSLFDFGARSASSGSGGGGEGDVASQFPLRFDVELVVPSTLRIENNLARLVASADLQLRGTYDHPQLFGRADVNHGDVLFEGRRYTVTKGTIDFNNPLRIEPFFDVEAETHVRVPNQNYRVTVRVTGTTGQMQPTIESDPPLPTATAVALLFGDVNLSQSSQLGLGAVELQAQNPAELQKDILTTRATQLLASPISSQVGRVVEQTFGVDTFQLSPSLFDPYDPSSFTTTATRVNPSARVTIGKRISERVYLTFSRSLSSAINDQIILLEYDATDRFSWILSRNEDQSYSLEVSVRHTF